MTADPTRTSWPVIGLLYLCGLSASLQIGIIPPLAATLIAEHGLSLEQVGWATSLINFMGVPLSLAAGGLAMRIGLKRAMVGGLILMAAGEALALLAHAPLAFLAARLICGLGYLMIVIIVPTLKLLSAAPRHRPMTMGLWGTFVPFGIALGTWLGSHLGGIAPTLLTASLAPIALAGLALLLIADRTPARPVAGRTSPYALLGDPVALLFSIGFGCYSASTLGRLAFLPLFLNDVAGFTATSAGTIASILGLTTAAGSLLVGWAGGRGLRFVPAVSVPLVLMTVASFGVFQPALVEGGMAIIMTSAVISIAVGGAVGAAAFGHVPAIARSPQNIAAANGMVATFGNLGSVVGPPATAALISVLGWPGASLAGALFSAASLGLLLLSALLAARRPAAGGATTRRA